MPPLWCQKIESPEFSLLIIWSECKQLIEKKSVSGINYVSFFLFSENLENYVPRIMEICNHYGTKTLSMKNIVY